MGVLTQLKIGLAVVGLILFGYGVRAGHAGLRWMGIAFLAAAFLARFLGPRSSRRSPHDE